MVYPKIVIMDLGNTIIDNIEIDFEKGSKYIYDTYCLPTSPWNILLEDIHSIFKNGYQKRNHDDFELHFHNYLRYIDSTIGFSKDVAYDKLEKEFIDHAFQKKIVEGVIPFLEEMKVHQVDIYILSNSSFSTKALWYELEKFQVSSYIKEVFSSADYILRKPNLLFFNVIVKKLKRLYPNTKTSEIWYIGNDYYFDVKGAYQAGLKSIWLNRKDEPNFENIPCLNISSYYQLIEELKKVSL